MDKTIPHWKTDYTFSDYIKHYKPLCNISETEAFGLLMALDIENQEVIKRLKRQISDLTDQCKQITKAADGCTDIILTKKKMGRPRLTDQEKIQKGIDQAHIKIAFSVEMFHQEKAMKEGTSSFVNSDPEFKKKVDEMMNKQKERAEAYGYALITVNPINDTRLEYLEERMNKFLKKKWVNECYWVFEQRCKEIDDIDSYGKGLHMHILVAVDGKAKHEVHRETHNTFKNVVGNDKHIDVRMVQKSRVEHAIKYLLGYKDQKGKSPEKMDGVYVDYQWRMDNELDQIYSKNPDPHFDLVTFVESESLQDFEGEAKEDEDTHQDLITLEEESESPL